MIVGKFHQGSGLGNQLFRYVFTRVKAADLEIPFGIENPRNFKGFSFLDLDMGVPISNIKHSYTEHKELNGQNIDIRGYDPAEREIRPFTSVEGEFQDEKYFSHRLTEVNEWLSPTLPAPEIGSNECVLAHRGGEYTLFPDLYLAREYWDNAMNNMRKYRYDMRFRVVTDDIIEAQRMFPELYVSHEIAHDWLSIRYAPYLILSNSSFNLLPSLLNENAKLIIAPLHWSRHNIGVWAMRQNVYRKFTYQNKQGELL